MHDGGEVVKLVAGIRQPATVAAGVVLALRQSTGVTLGQDGRDPLPLILEELRGHLILSRHSSIHHAHLLIRHCIDIELLNTNRCPISLFTISSIYHVSMPCLENLKEGETGCQTKQVRAEDRAGSIYCQ